MVCVIYPEELDVIVIWPRKETYLTNTGVIQIQTMGFAVPCSNQCASDWNTHTHTHTHTQTLLLTNHKIMQKHEHSAPD